MPDTTPLIRIVRMTLHPEGVSEFRDMFEEVSPRIRATRGCLHLELWLDVRYPNLVTTYSKWESQEALDAYRQSPLFKGTWEKTRLLFAAPPFVASHYSASN